MEGGSKGDSVGSVNPGVVSSGGQSPGASQKLLVPASPSDRPPATPHRSLQTQPRWHTLLLPHFADQAGEAQSRPDLSRPRGSRLQSPCRLCPLQGPPLGSRSHCLRTNALTEPKSPSLTLCDFSNSQGFPACRALLCEIRGRTASENHRREQPVVQQQADLAGGDLGARAHHWGSSPR